MGLARVNLNTALAVIEMYRWSLSSKEYDNTEGTCKVKIIWYASIAFKSVTHRWQTTLVDMVIHPRALDIELSIERFSNLYQ